MKPKATIGLKAKTITMSLDLYQQMVKDRELSQKLCDILMKQIDNLKEELEELK